MNDNEKINEIKTLVEASKAFLYWESEVNLKFEDFTIQDIETGLIMQQGKKSAYCIFLKDDKINSVLYDLTVV